MGYLVTVEADTLVFAFGLVMLVCIRLKTGRVSYESNWIMLLLSLVLVLQLLLVSFWAMNVGPNTTAVLLRNIVFFFYYMINNLIPLMWLFYIRFQVYHGKKNKIFGLHIVPFAFSTVLLLLNPFIHCLYMIDSSNTYHKGSLFYLNVALCYSYIVGAFLITIVNRKKLEKWRSISLMLFCLPPIIGSVIQFTVGGIDLIWAGAILSIIILYLGLLSNSMNIDYLTGLYNRMQFDQYITAKINRSAPGRSFSGIMIDVDRFKEINDKFGHQAGDEALKATAKLLRRCIGPSDFVARLGGDEFIIVLDTDDIETVGQVADNIHLAFEKYNRLSQRPFVLRLSMGYDVYDELHPMTKQQFLRHIDHLMYADKRKHKMIYEYTASEFHGE